MVKVRIQLGSESGGSTNPFTVAKQVHAEGGVSSFYKGLDSALLRQVVYGTLRLGIYFNMTEYFKKQNEGKLATKHMVLSSFTAGTFGSFIGNPADLCLVRMQADATLPPAERRNYTSVFNALTTIVKTEGVPALWAGAVPTMTRATCLNMAMMISYDTAKQKIVDVTGRKPSELYVQFLASMVSACCTAFFSLPADNIKTKMQKQKPNAEGVLPYANMIDCIKKSAAKEGITGFWAGLPTYYFRVGPHAAIVLLTSEVYRKMLGIGKK